MIAEKVMKKLMSPTRQRDSYEHLRRHGNNFFSSNQNIYKNKHLHYASIINHGLIPNSVYITS